MTLRTFIILLLFFFAHNSWGQTSLPTKKQLLKVFKASIRQDSKLKISTNSNPWIICNDDSSYYKSDTLKLFSHSNNYPDCKCFCFIDWTFYKKDAFVMSREYIDEPRRVSVSKADDWYTIKLLQKNEDLLLETYNQDKLIERFEVITIDKAIILKRIKLNP